ncbi:MAG: hypothetical protein AAF423_00450 [Pseudomonadota bacterium]
MQPQFEHFWALFKAISRTPLITISSTDMRDLELLKIAEVLPDLFDQKHGIHLISVTWNLESDYTAKKIAEAISVAEKRFPGHKFILLAQNEIETLKMSSLGVGNILANSSIFMDEQIWRVYPGQKKLYDALYVARLSKFKRHDLARNISKPAFVYGNTIDEANDTALERVRETVPHADYINHSFGDDYAYLSPEEICMLSAQSSVGLALSEVEGYMRASIQYLMCGLPVVSVPSIGGRDRYYSPEYCMIVDTDADAVANAVWELSARELNKEAVRKHVARLIAFDRYNFMRAINKLAKSVFGRETLSLNFADFSNTLSNPEPINEVIARYAETS